MRRGSFSVLVVALVLAACSSDDPEQAAPTEVEQPSGDAEVLDPDDADETDEEEPESPGSSLEVTGQVDRSDVEIRAAEILTELEATAEPQGALVEIPDDVLFDFDSAELRSDASVVLDDVVEVLTLLEDAPAEIRGHTDDVGDDEYNLELSQRRAEAVADYLVDAGVDRSRLTTEGLGSSEPVADNSQPDGSDDPEGRARNRRVEVLLPTVDLETLGQE